nr:ankyrin repeat domain-containing protein 39 isoform X2 [Parasteatoda tepidariorum]
MDGNIEKLNKILNNVDPSLPDSSGYTALHYGARNGREDVCKLLLVKGANPNAQTNGGATPLHRAAYVGNSRIVSMLLLHKANPSICDSDGKTPLHKAAEGQHHDVIQMLVAFSPELKHVKDKRGCTALNYLKDQCKLSELLS